MGGLEKEVMMMCTVPTCRTMVPVSLFVIHFETRHPWIDVQYITWDEQSLFCIDAYNQHHNETRCVTLLMYQDLVSGAYNPIQVLVKKCGSMRPEGPFYRIWLAGYFPDTSYRFAVEAGDFHSPWTCVIPPSEIHEPGGAYLRAIGLCVNAVLVDGARVVYPAAYGELAAVSEFPDEEILDVGVEDFGRDFGATDMNYGVGDSRGRGRGRGRGGGRSRGRGRGRGRARGRGRGSIYGRGRRGHGNGTYLITGKIVLVHQQAP